MDGSQQKQIDKIERRIRRHGHTVKAMLRAADVSSSQWVRWKQGKQTPLRTTWQRIEAAVANLTNGGGR